MACNGGAKIARSRSILVDKLTAGVRLTSTTALGSRSVVSDVATAADTSGREHLRRDVSPGCCSE